MLRMGEHQVFGRFQRKVDDVVPEHGVLLTTAAQNIDTVGVCLAEKSPSKKLLVCPKTSLKKLRVHFAFGTFQAQRTLRRV